jgi:2-polyprenyl-3-methyl-5-hydroxy-6-metoxy-1,4-benzoquinol methylase
LKEIEALIDKRLVHKRILDFGSGFGFFLAAAQECGWDAHGLEPLPAASVYARARFQLKIITDTLHEHTYPEDYFDVVTAFQVFEHLPNPGESLKWLHKSLKEKGIILIEVPRFDTWSVTLLRAGHRHFVQDHLNFFSKATLGMLLRNHGFEILKSYPSKRIMSIQHFYSCWLVKKLPKILHQPGARILKLVGLWNISFSLSIGDILTVIARKM